MMGKDYTLAIIIVNYDDNLWTDQNLVLDPDLPSGWRTITDSTGTYYWHVPTGATQWHHPRLTANGPKNGPKIQEQSQSHSSEPDQHRTSWPEDDLTHQDSDSQEFSVRSLGWMQVLEEDLSPGRSSLAVSHVIQQLSHCKSPAQVYTRTTPGLHQVYTRTSPGLHQVYTRTSGSASTAAPAQNHFRRNPVQNQTRSRPDPPQAQSRSQESAEPLEASGEGREMKLLLKKDSLILLDPLDHTPLHCQPISNIRVWGVGCNHGRDRDFAFVAGDKDSCILKCHVFRCDVPAKTIATALHRLCTRMMSDRSVRPTRSLTMESISPEDFPRQVECVEALQQQVQKFDVRYIGNLPVSVAMGMEVLNRAIDSLMTCSDPDEWDPASIQVSHTCLSLWRGQEQVWEVQVRRLTFLGVGHDSHTFAVIIDNGTENGTDNGTVNSGTMESGTVDSGTQQFQCHVFYCQPDAGYISEAVQAACMVQYQRCLVAQTPRLRPKVKRASSVDATTTGLFRFHGNSGANSGVSGSIANISSGVSGVSSVSVGGVRRVLAFFETIRNKQTATS